MIQNNHVKEILKLSVDERIRAVEETWDSIEENNLKDVSSDDLDLLEKRLEEYKKDPSIALSWEESKKRIAEARAK